MRPQSLLVTVLALVCGGGAAVGVKEWAQRNQEAGAKADTVPVVVAAADIPPFAVIEPDMVTTKDWPKDMVPADALLKPDQAIDRGVLQPMVKNEVLLEAKLAPRGAGRGMAAKIPKGMRAFTIHTPNIEASVAGFVLPGNRVDVLLTLDSRLNREPERDLTGGATTATLLQNIEILAVEQRVVAPAESKVAPDQLKSVTLLVNPQQANTLYLAQSKGKLSLALRNLGDEETAATRPVHLSNLMGETARPAPAAGADKPAPPPPLQVRTLRGNSESAVLIQTGGLQ
jgi:pilus assembly protein CpaB